MEGQDHTGLRGSALLYFMRSRYGPLLVGLPPLFLALHLAGVTVFRCPLMASTGCRCPGCGLTRGAAALVRGDVPASLALHPFAIFFTFAWLVLAVHWLMPTALRERLEAFVSTAERRVPLSTWLMLGFLIYGTARLVFDVGGVTTS